MYKISLAVLVALAISPTAHAQRLISIAEQQYPAGVLPHMDAIVLVALTITADGRPEGATVSESSGFPPFDQSALATVATARFAPAVDKDGKSVASRAVFPVRYGAESFTVDRKCRGLNNEMKEFVRFNPRLRPDATKSVVDIKKYLVDGQFRGEVSPGSTVKSRTERLAMIWELIVEQCADEPQTLIGTVIERVVKTNGY